MKQVFDIDLYIQDCIKFNATMEDMESYKLWLKACEGQQVIDVGNELFLTCRGTDGIDYYICKKWVKSVSE